MLCHVYKGVLRRVIPRRRPTETPMASSVRRVHSMLCETVSQKPLPVHLAFCTFSHLRSVLRAFTTLFGVDGELETAVLHVSQANTTVVSTPKEQSKGIGLVEPTFSRLREKAESVSEVTRRIPRPFRLHAKHTRSH